MAKYVYDEEAHERFHIDVVHEIDRRPARLVERMAEHHASTERHQRTLVRSIVALHGDCGNGEGECDSDLDELVPMADRTNWGCETTSHRSAPRYRVPTPTAEDD